MAQFLNKLILTPVGDGQRWVLITDLVYVSTAGIRFTVPAGFLTDLASVPQIFWNILPPFGQYDDAAVLHDYLYRLHGRLQRSGDRGLSRADCDALLLEAMAELGTPLWKRWLIYCNVRAFGWLVWRNQPLNVYPASSGAQPSTFNCPQ